jgi:hypothetical protein
MATKTPRRTSKAAARIKRIVEKALRPRRTEDDLPTWYPYPRPPFIEYPTFTLRAIATDPSRERFDLRPALAWEIWRKEDYGSPTRVAIFFDEQLARAYTARMNGQR